MPTQLPSHVRLQLLPPADSVAVLQRRQLLQPAFSWQDVWQEEHARAFTVAKMMRTDLLATVYGEVQRALSEGKSFAEFEAALTPTLQREGWWGRKEMRDPLTGERREVQLGSPQRLRLIYDVNLRQSYAAGRWARIERQRRVNPLIVYRTMRDGRVRPLHRAWDAVALPVDHPWWNTHFPPNGWRCRCAAYGTDEAGLKRLEAAGETIQRRAPRTQMQRFTNKRTGQVTQVPRGIDPGFGYNPGKVKPSEYAMQQLALKAQQLQAVAPAIGQAAQAAGPALTTPADFTAAGRVIAEQHWDRLGGVDLAKVQHWRDALMRQLQAERPFDTPAKVVSSGAGAALVRNASRLYPDEWTAVADAAGKLHVRARANTRGGAYTMPPQLAGKPVKLGGFGVVVGNAGDCYLEVRSGSLGNAVHEFAHRLQAVLPQLDAIFQALHRQRTASDPLERLKDVTNNPTYGPSELTRKDHYLDPYQGKEYPQGALEVMTMAFELFLGNDTRQLRKLLEKDPDMAHLVIGLLRHWRP